MDNAVAVGCERFVVGDDDECLPHVAPQVEEQAVELGAVVAVETARGFVGKHHGRTVDECAGHCRTLLFAARKLCRAVRGAVGKSEIVNEFRCLGKCLGAASAPDQSGHGHVLEQCELGQELMELKHEADGCVAETCEPRGRECAYIRAVVDHRAGGGAVERAHDLEQSGFACSAWADDAHNLPLVDGEVNAAYHFKRAEAAVYVVQFYHR